MTQPPLPPLRLALACFGSALCFLLAASAGLVGVVPDLAAGLFPLPRVIVVVHLFTLGWVTLSMIAALHHFVPVALHTRVLPEGAAWTQLMLFDAGVLCFAAGELAGSARVALAGAALLGAGLLLFAASLAAAMLRVRPRGRTALALLVAACFLSVVIGLGVLLAGNRAFGWGGASRLSILALHVRVALVGWVLLVLVAVGQRLLPMFLLTRAPDVRFATASLVLLAGGAASLLPLAGATGPLLPWLPLLPAAAGLALFLFQAGQAYRWSRQPGDPGLRLAGFGLLFLGLALAMAPFATGEVWRRPQPVVVLVATVVLGALTLFIAGHYYRLVPFLVWSSRWAPLPHGPHAPRSPDRLYRPAAATASLVLLVAGAAIVVGGLGAGLESVARAGALAFAAGAAVLAWQMATVMTSRPEVVRVRQAEVSPPR